MPVTVGRVRILSIAFLATLVSMSVLHGGVFAPHAAAQTVSDKPDARGVTSKRDIRRLQRLLKLLSAKNPHRFASTDPGVVDGTLGKSTVTAIRNFQRTIGVRQNPSVTSALFAQILTAQAESPTPAPTAAPVKKAGAGREPRQARYAQLVSMKDKARIEGEWARLIQKSPVLLKDYKPIIETANLNQRGTYYRILVGPFDGFQAARSFCLELRKDGQRCLVKKRDIIKPNTSIAGPSIKTATAIPGARPAPQSAPASVPGSTPAPVSPETSPPISPEVSLATPAPAAQPEPSRTAMPGPTTAVADVAIAETARATPPTAEAVDRPVEQADPREALANRPTPLENTPPATTVVTAPQLPGPDVKASAPAPAADMQTAAAVPVVDKAVTAEKATPRATTPTKSVVQWLGRVNRTVFQPYLAPGMAAVAGTLFGLLILMWWQRRRKGLMFQALQTDPWLDAQEFEFEHQDGEPAADNVLEDLRVQFESPELAECRKVRDSFLHGLAKTDVAEESTVAASEKSMMVNRRLNQMIATDPAAYKSIFLNWVFLNHAAAALERSEYTLKRLDPRIQREFHLLGSFFKIHLLELEARHHVRDRLPNVFATLHQHES